MWRRTALITMILASLAGCPSRSTNEPKTPEAGTEGGACFPNGTCNDGLTCLSALCVDAGEGEGESERDFSVTGFVQKGPYVQGTEVQIRELDDDLVPTGRTFVATISGDDGAFSSAGRLEEPLVELSASGFYFNEVSGQLSAAPLTLQALADVTNAETININLLTHLERKRVAFLMSSGLDFGEAKHQALVEVLASFGISLGFDVAAESLDIASDGEADAALLAVSSIVQATRSEAEVTELLAVIASDIETDGTLDDAETRRSLTDSVDFLKQHAFEVRANVAARYRALGRFVDVGPFEEYVFLLDDVAPVLTATTPTDGDVAVVAGASAVFNEILDPSSVTRTGVRLQRSDGNEVSGQIGISYSGPESTVSFEAAVPLAGQFTFLIDGVRDLGGNAVNSIRVSFRVPTVKIGLHYGDGNYSADYQVRAPGEGERFYAFPLEIQQSFIGDVALLGFDCVPNDVLLYSDGDSSPRSLLTRFSYFLPCADPLGSDCGDQLGQDAVRGWNPQTPIVGPDGINPVAPGNPGIAIHLNDFSFAAGERYWLVWYSSSARCGDGSYGSQVPEWPFGGQMVSVDGTTWEPWTRPTQARIAVLGH